MPIFDNDILPSANFFCDRRCCRDILIRFSQIRFNSCKDYVANLRLSFFKYFCVICDRNTLPAAANSRQFSLMIFFQLPIANFFLGSQMSQKYFYLMYADFDFMAPMNSLRSITPSPHHSIPTAHFTPCLTCSKNIVSL